MNEGGHPHNWNQLSGQCMSVLREFLQNLKNTNTKCLEQHQQQSKVVDNMGKIISPIERHKLYIRKLNESFGVRRLVATPTVDPANEKLQQQQKTQFPYTGQFTSTPTVSNVDNQLKSPLKRYGQMIKKTTATSLNQRLTLLYESTMTVFKQKVLELPGIHYLFHESEEAMFYYILSNAEMIIWIVQGLGGICTASLAEDSYGVVQTILPEFLNILLQMEEQLEKIEIICANRSYQTIENTDLNNLKKSINRVLHKVTCTFGEYLTDFIDDLYKLNKLKQYARYEM